MKSLYVPAWPGLAVEHFQQRPHDESMPFPLNAQNTVYFYRARNALYHLFRALQWQQDEVVLVPDYHSGNEVSALRAAGANVCFYPIRFNLQPDLDAVERLCRQRKPRALLTIHYLGWPQPVEQLAALCRRYGVLLIEDCALALLSETQGRALGSFGDFAVYCLYKTLPIPNGGLLVQNRRTLPGLAQLDLQSCGLTSISGRVTELFLERIRSRHDRTGRILSGIKSAIGRSLTAAGVKRIPVGDMGFELTQVDVVMSALSRNLLPRFDYREIRERRRRNFLMLRERLEGKVSLLISELGEGVCPLFFPVLVNDKHEVARELWRQRISAVEFWNYGDPESDREHRSDAAFLRRHVLELPVHQDITPEQIDYMVERLLDLPLSSSRNIKRVA